MNSGKNARRKRTDPASKTAARGSNRIANGALGLVIVAGGLFFLFDRPGVPDAERTTPSPLAGDSGAAAHDPPPTTYSLSDDGVRVAHIDVRRLTEWCRKHDLPDPPSLPQAEPSVADAVVDALRHVVRDPGAESFGRAGMICESLDCHQSAAEYFRRATDADAGDFRWPYYRGCIFQILGLNDLASQTLEKAKTLDPKYATTYGRLGQLYLENGDLKLAEARFAQYVERAPQDSLGHVGLARVAIARRDFDVALVHARRGAQNGANDFQAHYALARAHAGVGDGPSARRHFDICAKLPKGLWFALRDPLDQQLHAITDSADRITYEIERLQAIRDWPRLIALVEQVIKRRPGDSSMMTNLAALYRKTKRFDDAHRLLDDAERINPDLLLVQINRAEVFLGERRYEEALRRADEIIHANPKTPRAQNVRGRSLFVLKRYAEAAFAMHECVRLQPDNAGNTLILAEALLADDRPEEAARYYRRVLELSPDHDQARRRLAQLQKKVSG